MSRGFHYYVFLCHRAKDKVVVRPLVERLRADGLNVWSCPPQPLGEGGFDECMLKPGDSILAKIEPPSLRSYSWTWEIQEYYVLACPAVASELRRRAGILLFRNSLNRERRFIPLRLDDAPIKSSLEQFDCFERRAKKCG